MTPEEKSIALRMSEEAYPLPEKSDFMADRQTIYFERLAYLAGFTASHDLDARIREEHGEMLIKLKGLDLTEMRWSSPEFADSIQALIDKIESNER